MNKLKPCPFCGGNGELQERNIGFTVLCVDGSCGNAFTWWSSSKDEAVNAWNTRADGWIRVDDELPEIDSYVIASKKEGATYKQQAVICKFTKYGFDIVNVTHWIPLPQPPKVTK